MINISDSIAIACISIATIAIYYQQRWQYHILAAVIGLGLSFQYLDTIALAPLLGLSAFLKLCKVEKPVIKAGGYAGTILLGLALSFHLIPGFNNILIFEKLFLSPDASPYTMYFNWDKQVAAFSFIYLLGFDRDLGSLKRGLKGFLPYLVPVALFLIGTGYLMSWLRWEPKVPEFIALWMLKNLLFTCVSEEVFFRGFLQSKALEKWPKLNPYWIIAAIGILFGLVHFQGGWIYVLLASMAGFIYGLAAFRCQSLEAAIFCHFAVNLIHILCFTYPRLA